MNIVWKGNIDTNSSSRGGHIPMVIVNHISAGTMASMDSWFTSAGNKVSSAHFGISKLGVIHQYVDIRRMSWANGIGALDIANSNTPVIIDHPGINPNLYSISIEHEGIDGDLTPEQFAASVWLHKYIKDQIFVIWSVETQLDRYHVIGHFMVSPKNKPHCPGPKFPWDLLFAALGEEEVIMLDVGVANTIINTWMIPDLQDAEKKKVEAETKAIALQQEIDYISWLRNQLLIASGQPTI